MILCQKVSLLTKLINIYIIYIKYCRFIVLCILLNSLDFIVFGCNNIFKNNFYGTK